MKSEENFPKGITQEFVFDGNTQDISVSLMQVYNLTEEQSRFLTAVFLIENVRFNNHIKDNGLSNDYENSKIIKHVGLWVFNNEPPLSAQVFRSRYVVQIKTIMKAVIDASFIEGIMQTVKSVVNNGDCSDLSSYVLIAVLNMLKSIALHIEYLDDYEICCYKIAALWQWKNKYDAFTIENIYEIMINDKQAICSNIDKEWDCPFRGREYSDYKCSIDCQKLGKIFDRLCKKEVFCKAKNRNGYQIKDRWYIWE